MSRKIASNSNDPELIQWQLQLLSQWLHENPQINAYKDMNNLLFFLRCCKYDLERTKKKLKGFYLMRAERPEWFDNCDPFLTEIQELLRIGVFLPVDGVDEEQRKVVIVRTGAHDPKKHTQNNVFKVGKMILDLVLQFEPENCARGIVAIFDMSGVQLGHALQLKPKLIKHSVDSWHAYPCQPKKLEFIHAPRHVNILLNTFKVFMTAKMRSRVSVEKVNSTVKCENLPSDIGGKGMCYQELALKWKQIVENNAEFFKEQEKYKSVVVNQ